MFFVWQQPVISFFIYICKQINKIDDEFYSIYILVVAQLGIEKS